LSKYSIEITTSAQRQFKKLPQNLQDRILPKLFELEIHPRSLGTKKLADSNFYRIRVGDYRIIYSIDDATKNIKILDMAHRRDIYR
jgi:mRNA interferase RelE/StbE